VLIESADVGFTEPEGILHKMLATRARATARIKSDRSEKSFMATTDRQHGLTVGYKKVFVTAGLRLWSFF
jgi:hypothetical protein